MRVRLHYTQVARGATWKIKNAGKGTCNGPANRKNEYVTSFMKKCQMKFFDKAKLVKSLSWAPAGQKLISMSQKRSKITILVPWTPLWVWRNLWNPSQKKVLKKMHKINLTFIGLCIANIFAEYNQQDATFHNLFISVRCSTHFRRVFRPSSGAQNCTYSVRYLSDQHLTLYVQFWAP